MTSSIDWNTHPTVRNGKSRFTEAGRALAAQLPETGSARLAHLEAFRCASAVYQDVWFHKGAHLGLWHMHAMFAWAELWRMGEDLKRRELVELKLGAKDSSNVVQPSPSFTTLRQRMSTAILRGATPGSVFVDDEAKLELESWYSLVIGAAMSAQRSLT